MTPICIASDCRPPSRPSGRTAAENDGGSWPAVLTRRTFLGALSAGAVGMGYKPSGIRIATMDLVLRLAGKPEALPVARQLGFCGVQVTLGKPGENGRLPLEDPALQQRYRVACRQSGIPLTATYLDVLHISCLKNDPGAPDWVRKGIAITRNLHANTLMTVFFGRCAIGSRVELDTVIDAFRDLVREAEKAGVTIGFENTLSGEDNRYAIDRMNSASFKVWYDIGNSTYNGFDVPQEIRMLGRDRICQFHFKDKGYLGEGKVQLGPVLEAIRDIGFSGFADLETVSSPDTVEADARRNLDYVQKAMPGFCHTCG